jgi:hypothetical protein
MSFLPPIGALIALLCEAFAQEKEGTGRQEDASVLYGDIVRVRKPLAGSPH